MEFYDGMTDLIVKSGVKEVLADHPVSADFIEAVNDEVTELLNEVAERAEANDRKTVKPRDLLAGNVYRDSVFKTIVAVGCTLFVGSPY
jgi:histone H3/H4